MLLMLLGIATACGPKEMTPEQIYNEQASGVVMVLNQFYHSIELSNGDVIYFSDFKDGELEDMAFDEDSITGSMAFGTAFFIDDQGTLLTNRHVVSPEIPKSEIKRYVKGLVKTVKEYYKELQDMMEEKYNELQEAIENDTYRGYDETYGFYTEESEENEERRAQQEELREAYHKVQQRIDAIEDIDLDEINITTHSKISIAYHDTYVTGPEDFKPCVVVKTSDKENVDLALIRLTTKETPGNAHIFSLPEDQGNKLGPDKEEREALKLNQQLILIGYNEGVRLATTREGIKAQLTTGNISQQPDDDRVMYTIPVLHGSSGSPVLNQWGEVVAVNFAGLDGTQSFNFGIPLKQIRKFLNE
jgi:V8-like Glu-specific endopeptidase